MSLGKSSSVSPAIALPQVFARSRSWCSPRTTLSSNDLVTARGLEREELKSQTTAVAAGGTAAAMYLDAKYHIRKDIKVIHALRKIEAARAVAIREKRQSLYYFFEDSVKRRGDGDCIWSRDGCYSWNETYDKAHQYGQWFLSQGVKPNHLVAFYLHNSPDFIFAWLGLWSIGAAPAMINYNLTGKALLHCLKISGANLLLVDPDEQFQQRINGSLDAIEGELGMKKVTLGTLTLAEIRSIPPKRPEDSHRAGLQGNWPLVIFYTSGTTGMPKAVPFNHDRGFDRGFRGTSVHVTKDDDRWYDCMPMYHGTGGIVAMTQMMQGITLCIGKKFSTSKFWDEIRDSRATWFTYVGETARYLLSAPATPRDRDHCCRGMYGNGLRPDVWKKFQERFGISEVYEFFSSSEGVFGLAIWAKGDYFGSCVGHHGAITRLLTRNVFVPVRVDAATGAVLRDPETGLAIREPYEKGGEILTAVESEAVFAGYFKNPEATAKKFERNVLKKGDLFYRSGDALKRTNDGKWLFLDRLGDTFRWKGENVSTAEVGEVVGRYPGVVEANVYGVALPKHDGRAGCAAIYIEPSERSTFDFAGLLRHSRTQLPKYAVPVFIRVVKQMTPIHNNKQNKVPLREEGVDPTKISPEDQMYFVPAGHHTYVPFTDEDWASISMERARL